jgi:hypothetical protein
MQILMDVVMNLACQGQHSSKTRANEIPIRCHPPVMLDQILAAKTLTSRIHTRLGRGLLVGRLLLALASPAVAAGDAGE